MNPLAKVTDTELKAIEMQILNCNDQEMGGEPLSVTVPYLLREWDSRKQYLFDNVFHGELILTKHAVFSKNATQIAAEIDQAWDNTLSTEGKKFWQAFTNFCQTQRRNLYRGHPAWAYTMTHEEMLQEQSWYRCEQILSNEVLAANEISEDFEIDLPKPDGTTRPYKVQKGSRPMRVINRLNNAFHFGEPEGAKELAVWQSRFLNDKKLEGDVCLSIHPLDYMTMSENNCDWTSCMNWPEGGCYRGGTVEMMNSPMVIVAYLKSSKNPLNMDLGWNRDLKEREWMPWSNKKWRILICVNEYGIFSVKGYPYQHKELTQFCMEWIASLINNRKFNAPKQFRPYRDKLMNNEETYLNINPRTYRMYNDFGSCDHYMMLDATYADSLPKDEITYCNFVYSGASECMYCGSLAYIDSANGVYFDGEGMLTCTKCSGHCNSEESACDLCGAVYPNEDMIWVGETLVCPDCFETECFEDSWTYEFGFNDDSTNLIITRIGKDNVEVGKVISFNIEGWLKNGVYENYRQKINNGKTVKIKEEDLNEYGRRYLRNTILNNKRQDTWYF